MAETAEQKEILIPADKLRDFVQAVFMKLGVPKDDAWVTADNLVAADLRGIPSHGVARLERYVKGIQQGLIKPATECTVAAESAATATLDAHDGLGQPAAKAAMELAMKKAAAVGAGFVAVKNSNHYGIAGYYSMMALERDMIGISMTNSAPLVVPTYGREIIVGTNPLSVAAPAGKERPFVLDMATSTVPRGKVEVYDRLKKPMPDGWAADENGASTHDATQVLGNLLKRRGGGLLPLGGEGELLGGHKGYGLSLMIDVLSGVLAGGAFGIHVYETKDGKPQPANVCHLLGALDLKGFQEPEEFKKKLDAYIQDLRNGPKAAGQGRIYVHGEKEYEKMEKHLKTGVPVHPKSVGAMRHIAGELSVAFPE